MWNRKPVDFIQTQDVPWSPVAEGTFGYSGRGRKRLLSADPSTGAESAVHQLTERQQGAVASDVDFFVTGGDGTLDGTPLKVGDYVYAPAQSYLDMTPGALGLSLFAGWWGLPGLEPDEGSGQELLRIRTEEETWQSPDWNGETPLHLGAMMKPLRQGPGVNIYLAAMLPGWKCEMEESHPVYEESFKIYGDILMGSRGVIRDGGYFFRAPHVFHGPLYSRGGTMSFIRSDGPTTTTYKQPASGGAWDELADKSYVS